MAAPLILACLWVLAATVVAFLPMRRQFAPGLALLFAAPVLIGWLWWEFGWFVGLASAAAFVSMFRHPLVYLLKRARGRET